MTFVFSLTQMLVFLSLYAHIARHMNVRMADYETQSGLFAYVGWSDTL